MSKLVLIYNASGTVIGELKYLFNKLACSIKKKESPCPACDITHSLKELGMKKEFKDLLSKHKNLTLAHTNELSDNLAKFILQVELPVLLRVDAEESIQIVADRQRLLNCNGSVQEFRDTILNTV